MSREIKFRAWNGEEMISPDYITRDGYGYWKENSIPTTSKELMQYTGLKDKNGKEIYEGDVIKFHTGMKYRDSVNMKICFNQGCFGFRGLKHNGKRTISSFIPFSAIQSSLENNNIWLDAEEILEVTGNIHENKENERV